MNNEKRRFETGDLVKTIHRDQKMTVLSYQTTIDKQARRVICKWFEKDKAYTQIFSEDELEKIE